MTIPEKVAQAICQASCDTENCRCPYASEDQEIKEATAGMTTFLEAVAEEGWRLVRVEPTREQVLKGMEAAPLDYDWSTDEVTPVYRAMLDAADKFEVEE